jgi:hypothetical protein
MVILALCACGAEPTSPASEPLDTVEADPILPTGFGGEGIGPQPEYRLHVNLDMANSRLRGTQEVKIPNRTGVELSELIFRLYPNLPQYRGSMGIGSVWVDGQRGLSSLRENGTSLVIPLDPPLLPESSVTIKLTFDIDIPHRDTGYVLFGHSQGIWSLPDAYALLAVHDGVLGMAGAESGWHEEQAPSHGDAVFAEAAYYDVTLTLPPTLTLATTGSVVAEALDEAGQQVYHVVGGPLREFAWLASADYLQSETMADGALVRSYYMPGNEAAGQAALNSAAAALRVYSEEFGPYPFGEMAVVQAPLLHFGMEYPGLNLIGQDLYQGRRDELENRLSHEIAHQWWYAQVGNDQVNTPWLDEGLAEYSMVVYYEHVFGEARANTLVNQRWLVPYQAAVDNGYDSVVNQPSGAFGPEYEVIVYAKAALFFDALHQTIGDEAFQALLREYVNRYRWRIAKPGDLLALAESISGQELDGLYSHWILSKE